MTLANWSHVALIPTLVAVGAVAGSALSRSPSEPSAPVEDVVRARRIEIVDGKNVVRIRLEIANNDQIASFEMRDQKGIARLRAQVSGTDIASMYLHGPAGGDGFQPASTPSIQIYERPGAPSATFPGAGGTAKLPKTERTARDGKGDTVGVSRADLDLIWRQIDKIMITLDQASK